MKRWILAAVALALVIAIAWPFLFGGPTVEVKGASFAVEHRTGDDGPMSRRSPTRERPALAAGSAILCSWDRDRYLYFWSEGSRATFDVAFLDAGGKVLQVGRMRAYRGADILDDEGLASEVEARHALFMPEGTTDNLGLAIGDAVALSSGLAGATPDPMTVVKVAGKEVRVTLCETLKERRRGLMHRPKMSKDEGMLFLYRSARTGLNYYMRNTLMSLDIAYFDGNGRLVNAASTQRAENPATQGVRLDAPADGSAQFVLEMPIGWFRENGLVDAAGKPVKSPTLEIPETVRKRLPTAEEQQ